MAMRKDDDRIKDEGTILDENERYRHDPGEELKESYDNADAYEKDRIELRGITFFGLGLVLLIGVTFGLMWLMQGAMETQASQDDATSPMAMTADEKSQGMNLPPEPRLQGAPGFGVMVESSGERLNLELREPQSEYRALYKDWVKTWKEGRKDPQTGTVITLPIEEAKQRLLQQGIGKTRTPEQAAQSLRDVQQIPSYQSSGRATEVRRQ
jgi:hypothetical protein